MSQKGARATLALCSLVLAACGAKTLDFSDAGPAGDGTAGPFVTTSAATKVTKVDLLFMIDNSSSMADKQSILAAAVPDLIDQLVDPQCIDPVTGQPVGHPVNSTCLIGRLASKPISDIHIGIISSSLGNHGAAGVCQDDIDRSLGRQDPHNDDRGHLLTRGIGGATAPTFESKGFLFYNPSVPGALPSSTAVGEPFKSMVGGVGQHGCGYEASLESVYRFLVDPDPYTSIRIDSSSGGFGQAILSGTDQEVLRQRADFLRPDSLVSVVLITDENDCSVIDGGQGFYPLLPQFPDTGRSVLQPATSICKSNPNDMCCFNCGAAQTPLDCPSSLEDPACKGALNVLNDHPNLRCFNQKQRYGMDFLYPIERYIRGFARAKVPTRRGDIVDNPLFADLTCNPGAGCASGRDPSLVFVTGIVGVPWQVIALDPNDLRNGYKTAAQMRDDGTWANIVGDPLNAAGPVAPLDTHMVESIQPRRGLAGPGSVPGADPIHGHEWDPSLDSAQPNADLQYACTFDLVPPRTCVEPADCDCFGTAAELAKVQNPLCQNQQGQYTSQQLRGKAYPGTRILQVLQGLGDQGVTASICPAQTTTPSSADYGYVPAIAALVNRLRDPLGDRCMRNALPIDGASGRTACSIIEVFDDSSCRCESEPGRHLAPSDLITPEMRSKGSCQCQITQLEGDALRTCKTTFNPPSNIDNGWCYVDPAQDSEASCDMVTLCPLSDKRIIHFINVNSEPRPGSTAFLRCDLPPLTNAPPMVCQ